MSTPYVIQLSANTDLCLGVTSASPNAKVVLSLLGDGEDPLTQWHLDPHSGHVVLAGSDPDHPLYLDFEGNNPVNSIPLIVTSFVLGRNSQRWNWLGSPPYVMNLGAPGFCIDDRGAAQPGTNPMIFIQQAGNVNQQWQFLSASLAVAA